LKVVHLCTEVVPGGAANSALNLHEGLLSLGVESWILTGKLQGEVKNCILVSVEGGTADREKELAQELIWSQRTEKSNSHFSLDYAWGNLAEHPLLQEADILNFHWVSGLLDSNSSAALAGLGKPVVWTLHDMRPLTGGCHFSAGCLRFQEECGECPQVQFDSLNFTRRSIQAMAEALALLKPHFVAPSRWMIQNALTSSVSRNLTSSCIPYGVDTEIFRPASSTEARKKLGLERDVDYILLASHSLLEKRKGAEYAIRILEIFGSDPSTKERIAAGQIRLLCCGKTAEEFLPEGWHVERTGYVPPQEMASVYQAATLMLFTSTEDNLPNVILEAMACGLPVVGHAVGGAKDLLDGERGGERLFAPSEPGHGASLLALLLRGDECRREHGESLAEKIRSGYTLQHQAERYRSLYRELLASPMMPCAAATPINGGDDFLEHACVVISQRRENDRLLNTVDSLCSRIQALEEEIAFLREIQQAYVIIIDSKWVRLGGKFGLCKPGEERFRR